MKIIKYLTKENAIALSIYVLLSLIILRDILFTQYRLGFNQDWVFPSTAYELKVYVTQAFYLWNSNNLGTPIVYPTEYLLQYLLLPFSCLGFSGATVIRIILFLIFAVGGYSMYLLLRKSFKLGYIPSLVSAIFYITTPVVFNKFVAGHITYLIGYALSPLIIVYFKKYIDTTKAKYLVLVGLLIAFVSIQVQFGVMLFILILFYALLVAKINMRKTIKITLFLILIALLIHSFWTLPGLINRSGVAETVRVASNIEELKSWNTSLINAFGLIGYRSPHFETALNDHNYRPIWNIFSFSLLILIFSSLIVCRDSVPLPFGIISIISLIFTTALSDPFGGVVFFLYSNFPIFNIFREVYHLTFLISFSYSVMLAFTVNYIYNLNKIKIYTFTSILLILGIIIAYNPFIYMEDFDGQIQTYNFDNYDISLMDGYQGSGENYRVLYLPMIQPFKYENNTYNGIDPVISYSKKPTMGNYVNSEFIKYFALILHNDTYGNIDNLLDLLSIKYIFFRNNYLSMVPNYLNQGRYDVYDEIYDIRPIWTNKNLYDTLINEEEITLINKNKNILVFENRNYFPSIYSVPTITSVNSINDFHLTLKFNKFQKEKQNIIVLSQNQNKTIPQVHSSSRPHILSQQLNPTKYKLKIENAKEPFYLIFSETYHSGWQAYINTDTVQCTPITEYENVNVTECQYESKFFEINYLTRIFSESIPEEKHYVSNGYANAWYIDPQELGTGENFIVTLYFKPQSYFYLGFIISGLTFIGCVVYLLWDWRNRRSKLK